MPPSVPAKELAHRCDVFERQHRLMTLEALDYTPASLAKVDSFARRYYPVAAVLEWNHGMINIGCYVGEMVRRGLGGKWLAREPTQQSLVVNIGGRKLETNPFDAVADVLGDANASFQGFYDRLAVRAREGGLPPAPDHLPVTEKVAAAAMQFPEPTEPAEVVSRGQGLIIGKGKDGREHRRLLQSIDTERDRETLGTLTDRVRRTVEDRWADLQPGATREFVLQVNGRDELVFSLDLEKIAGGRECRFLFLSPDAVLLRGGTRAE